ncbi:hypothetical protein JDV02_004313 [Purpureocillium takamizusanense]|uniref:Uncharacterized protein n=1 Tax=Purpureocillium takamizusanense TaxID=2060973 RepID=A0A9Q8QEZ1_9HYPO|nr:uncharacterized protein JDV02_004313 [Purpureocillium takamizusanense]UNI18012.1 hypothetical protein JDV02_004313 [Purpureocillium takamizusanense]
MCFPLSRDYYSRPICDSSALLASARMSRPTRQQRGDPGCLTYNKTQSIRAPSRVGRLKGTSCSQFPFIHIFRPVTQSSLISSNLANINHPPNATNRLSRPGTTNNHI